MKAQLRLTEKEIAEAVAFWINAGVPHNFRTTEADITFVVSEPQKDIRGERSGRGRVVVVADVEPA